MHGKPQIILASASPRRRQLLEQIGVQFTVFPVSVDESIIDGESPAEYVSRLAAEKSLKGTRDAPQRLPVLGADTAVVIKNQILCKPVNQEHSIAMLTQLSGKQHRVLTAVSLRSDCHLQSLSISTVLFRNIEQDEMVAYWRSGEPQDKAGSYAIQGIGALFASRIEGSFSGIMGLPLLETFNLLKRNGINPFTDEKIVT